LLPSGRRRGDPAAAPAVLMRKDTNMEPEQNCEHAPEAVEVRTKSKASSSHGLIGQVAKLMGKTAGLAQSAGAKTADSLVATGRRAGKLLHVPSKLRSLVAYGTEKERKVEIEFEIERFARRIERLYARTGERICHSPLFDRSLLSMDPQLEALVSTVRDLEIELTDLQQQDQRDAEVSHPSVHEGSESAAEKTESQCTGGSQASQPSEPAPSPAPEEGTVPPSGTE